MKEIINCAAYCKGRRVADVELNEVHNVLKSTEQFVWIGLHEPSEEVLSKVQLEFGLHDLAVEDAHHRERQQIGRDHELQLGRLDGEVAAHLREGREGRVDAEGPDHRQQRQHRGDPDRDPRRAGVEVAGHLASMRGR